MKRAFAAALTLLATSSAMAADLGTKKPSPAPAFTSFNWTGAYVGVDAGYSFGRGRYSIPAVATAYSNPEPSGFSLGAHAGYRYQLQNNIVLGAEARIFANIDSKDKKELVAGVNGGQLENRWGGDARLSIGFAMDRLMPYIAGGLAFTELKGCATVTMTSPCAANTPFSDTRIGWTVGAGLAYAVTNNLIARIDYSYADFGRKNHSTAGVAGGITRAKLETHAVRAGLSYKF